MARYAEKEAPLLERIIMQEGLERTKAEDWARDEITRLSRENARLREALKPFKEGYDSMALVSKNLNKPLQEIIKLEKGMVSVKMKSIFEDDKMSLGDKIFFMECEMAAYFFLQCAILLQFKGDKI